MALQKTYSPDMKPVDNLIASMALREQDSLRVALNKEFYDGALRSLDEIPGMRSLISDAEVKGWSKNRRR